METFGLEVALTYQNLEIFNQDLSLLILNDIKLRSTVFNQTVQNETRSNENKYVKRNVPIGGVYSELWACEIVVILSYKIDSDPVDDGKPLCVS